MNHDVENSLVLAAQAAIEALRHGALPAERARAGAVLDQALRDFSISVATVRHTEPEFNGADYDPATDKNRLANQLGRVFDCMKESAWRTLEEIHQCTHDPIASISAQLRHLRKKRFGSYYVERRHRGDPSQGLYEYRVLSPADRIQHVVVDVQDLKGVADEFKQREIL